MKSEITKRWYLIFLISILAISTYITLKSICYYMEWKRPILSGFTHGIDLILKLIVWYTLIKQNAKLMTAVMVWGCFALFLSFAEDLVFILNRPHSFAHYLLYTIYVGVFLVVLIGGKKYIAINKEPSPEISN